MRFRWHFRPENYLTATQLVCSTDHNSFRKEWKMLLKILFQRIIWRYNVIECLQTLREKQNLNFRNLKEIVVR